MDKPMHPEMKQLFEKFFDKHFEETKREWVGLTQEEVEDSYNSDYKAQTRAVEAKLKENNNG